MIEDFQPGPYASTGPGKVIAMIAKNAVLILFAVVGFTKPVLSHHSFAAEYDGSQPVSVTGTVTKLEWTNPHIWFFVDAGDENREVVNWGFSAAPPGVLMRRGIMRDVMQVGDVIRVEGFRARDGSNNASGGSVTFADGRSVFTASSEDRSPRDDSN